MSRLQDEPQTNTATPVAKAAEPHPHHISAGKVILILLLLAVVVGAVALAGYLPRKERANAANAAAETEKTTLPTVTSALVKRAASDSDLTLPGTLSALVESSIYARASGYVKKRYVDIGDRVRAGQLMAEIDAPELDQQVAQARAAVAQAQQQMEQTKAALLQAEAQRDLAKLTSDRYNNLIGKGAVARQDADTQLSNYKTSEALVAAQQSTMRAAQENVKQSQANLDRVISLQDFKSVKAPFAGIVTARNIDTGSLISASGAGQGFAPNGGTAANGNEMFRVAQIGTIRMLVSVPQSSSEAIRTGMPADVTVNELPGRTFSGRVTRTTNSLDPNSRTLLVEVQVANGDGKLLPGMYAEVRFRSHRDTPPLLVPGDSLITTNSGLQVAVLRDAEGGNKKIHLQPVRIGRDFGAETEIVGGLQGDETVVVNPGDEVREGALVKAETEAANGRGAAKQ
jgi:RND family efflux transporter MFP subunit